MIGRAWEKTGPFILAAGALALVLWRGEVFFHYASTAHWHLDALYASVFNIAAAASAFLFAFYVYVCTAEGAILRQIRAGKIFKTAAGYMMRAIFNSAILALVTVPLVIAVPEPANHS